MISRNSVWASISLVAIATLGCDGAEEAPAPVACASVVAPAPAASSATMKQPRQLYLPDGGDRAPATSPRPEGTDIAPPTLARGGRCPAEMVDIAGQFCIDRFEASLVDHASGRKLSPYFAPVRRKVSREFNVWRKKAGATGSPAARNHQVPFPEVWQLKEDFEPRAVSQAGVVPHGYTTAVDARLACKNAGKRLCTEAEWVSACKGESRQKFPYGEKYEAGRCNVFREAHPAHVLHDNPSIGHLDPRLNQVRTSNGPLLRRTGGTPACVSRWGSDAVHDMVGNLDEWIDDETGVFVGGFYSRSTKQGCESRVSAHGPTYYDYSLGIRCCR